MTKTLTELLAEWEQATDDAVSIETGVALINEIRAKVWQMRGDFHRDNDTDEVYAAVIKAAGELETQYILHDTDPFGDAELAFLGAIQQLLSI